MTDNNSDKPWGEESGLLTAVLASCRDAIIASDLEGEIRVWNRGAAEIYQMSQEEALGASRGRIIPTERHDEIQRLSGAAREGLSIDHFDTVRLRRSGESFPAAVCGFPIRDDKGVVVGFATIERDISDRVRSADALRDALAAAEAASEAKTRFLANASHELRTPMNAIVGMTALALEEQLSPVLRDYLETIRESSDAMLHLVNDVLDLARFESDGFELEEVPFDPRDLVEATATVLGTAAHTKGIELVCRIAPETPHHVVGDPVRLRQVLTNLIGNAVKFTRDGEVVVEVQPTLIESQRCRLRVSVTDTGIGISKEDRERIFSPFTQVDGSVSRAYGGSGLGLAITAHLVQCFGGRLQLDSRLGRGSRFWFEFLVSLPPAEAKPAIGRTPRRIRGLRVLVVDDNESSRSAVVEQLRAWEIETEEVDSGAAAIERLRKARREGRPFDLAFIDALMPGLDGFSVASQIEEDAGALAKPILMASISDRLEFSRRCAEAGAIAYVQKPISQSQLLGAISQATGAAALDGETRQGLFDRPRVSPRKVLLVEDTPANRKVVQRVLERRGHRLEVAVNGREAVKAYHSDEYDLVLMDVQMPIMDGMQATKAIRDIELSDGRPPTPVVAMTAHSLRGDRERCLRAGMNGYLSKPLDLVELIDTVESPSPELPPPFSQPTSQRKGPAVNSPSEKSEENRPAIANIDSALNRLRGDQALLLDMANFFEEDSPKLLAEIKASIASGDFETLARSAHSIKGLAATFDSGPVVETARDLEVAAGAGDTESLKTLETLAETLAERAERLREFLRAYRAESSDS